MTRRGAGTHPACAIGHVRAAQAPASLADRVVGTSPIMAPTSAPSEPGSGPVEVRFRDGRVLSWDEPRIHHEGLFHEAVEVARCIAAGLTESPLRPLDATVATVELMERARVLMNDPA